MFSILVQRKKPKRENGDNTVCYRMPAPAALPPSHLEAARFHARRQLFLVLESRKWEREKRGGGAVRKKPGENHKIKIWKDLPFRL